MNRYLYDGQTRELLASSERVGGEIHTAVQFIGNWHRISPFAKSFGMDVEHGLWQGYHGELEIASDTNPGFIDALIDAAMADRNQ